MKPAPLWGRAWPAWAQRLEQARALALFSDFDGTLSPIVSRPRRVRLPIPTRDLLRKLARCRGLFVAIVSGRPADELQRLVRLSRVAYIGTHGIEVAWPGQRIQSRVGEADRARVERARQELEKAVGDVPGIWVERKPASVAVHYRNAPPAATPRIEREVGAVARRYRGQLELQEGKKVLELLPAVGASKAAAVRAMLGKLPRWLGATPLPIYVGDDRTDETVFRLLAPSRAGQAGRGLTILVDRPGRAGRERPAATVAEFLLEDPGEVRKFLRALLALRTGRRFARKRFVPAR